MKNSLLQMEQMFNYSLLVMSINVKNVPSDTCVQRTLNSAYAFAWSDQKLHCVHFGQPRMQGFLDTDNKDFDRSEKMRRPT